MKNAASKLVAKYIPHSWVRGFQTLEDMYDGADHQRFQEGDILILKGEKIMGWGIRPVIVINGYDQGYHLTIHAENSPFHLWETRDWVDINAKVAKDNQHHRKRTIEERFRKAYVLTIEEARELYGSTTMVIPQELAHPNAWLFQRQKVR